MHKMFTPHLRIENVTRMTRRLDQNITVSGHCGTAHCEVNAVRLLVESGADKAKFQYVDAMISNDDRIG